MTYTAAATRNYKNIYILALKPTRALVEEYQNANVAFSKVLTHTVWLSKCAVGNNVGLLNKKNSGRFI